VLRYHLTLGQIAWMQAAERSVLTRLALLPARDDLPGWAEDDPRRKPQPEPRGISAALTARYERMLAYWDRGRRPEGRPGSRSADEFLHLHAR